MHCIVNYATGAVNKVKLCVLWGEMLLSTDRRVRTAHSTAMVSLSQLCDGDYERIGTVRFYWV